MFDASALVEMAGKAAGWDVQLASDDELLEAARTLEQARRAIDAASAHVAAALDGRGVTDVRFGQRAAQWLASSLGLARAEATRRVRVGRKLRLLDVVDQALGRGDISFEHARLLADVANPRVQDAVGGAQTELVDLAQVLRFERWAAQVRGLVDLADQDGSHEPTPESNRLRLSDGLEGILDLDGSLVGDLGVSLRTAVEAEADRLFDAYRREAERKEAERTELERDGSADDRTEVPGRPRLLAEALAELVRRGASAVSGTAPAADVTIVIPVDHPALAGGGADQPVLDLRGRSVPGAALDVLCCDPVLRALVIDSLGVPLDLGAAVRFGSQDQRRAATGRDGGCVFPGCDAPPSWTDLHHVIHARDGGPTDLWNLASLCRRHHGVVHRTGWSMRTTDDQWFEFTTPGGATLASQRHGRPRAGPSVYSPRRSDRQE